MCTRSLANSSKIKPADRAKPTSNAAGVDKTDVIGYFVVFILSSAYLINEVKDLPDPVPKKKNQPPTNSESASEDQDEKTN